MPKEFKPYGAGKQVSEYIIKRPGARHWRTEINEQGKPTRVLYSDLSGGGRTTITLTKKGAEALKHMNLELKGSVKKVEISNVTDDTDHDAGDDNDNSSDGTSSDLVHVPERWTDLPRKELLSLASEIKGRRVTKTADAETLIEAYVEEHYDDDNDSPTSR